MATKHPAIFRTIKSAKVKNLLEIEGKIEQDAYGIFTPLFFFTIFEDFVRKDENKRITMQFSGQDVLVLAAAMDEAIETGETPKHYRNYTGGNTNGKWVTINNASGKDAEAILHLNFANKNKQIPMTFSKYEAKALSEILREAYRSIIRISDQAAWEKYINKLKAKIKK